MPQTNQNKVGVWLPNSGSPVYSSFWPNGDRAPGIVADFNFASSDTYASIKGGMFWNGSRTISTPAGQSEAGGVFSWGPTTDPMQDSTDEMSFGFNPMSELWFKMRFFVPSNYTHRFILRLSVTGDLSSWQVGDTIKGTDNIKGGILYLVSGTDVYILFPDDAGSNVTWTGTITNTTRGQSRSSTRIAFQSANNKLLAIWCNGYSGAGTSPTVVWEMLPDNLGGSTLYYHYAVDGGGTGQSGPASTSGEVPFIDIADRGKWINFIVHLKMATTPTGTDGVIEGWKRVDGAGSYTKLWTQTDAFIGARVGGGNFRAGYVHGWANSGFKDLTQIYDSRVTLASATIDGVV